MTKKTRNPINSEESIERRRSAVRKILAASSITAGGSVTSWQTPLIESVVLPAHAQTTGPGDQGPVISGQIGASEITGLLDLFISPAYAEEESDLIGGCIEITVDGSFITAAVTLNNSTRGSNTGVLSGCSSTEFIITPVNGFTVEGELDDPVNPTTCSGFVGPYEFSAVINGSCSVIAPTTTACPPPPEGTCPA